MPALAEVSAPVVRCDLRPRVRRMPDGSVQASTRFAAYRLLAAGELVRRDLSWGARWTACSPADAPAAVLSALHSAT